MLEVPILKEIRSYETKVIGPLTFRQLVGGAVCMVGCYLSYFIQMKLAGNFWGFLVFCGALPGFLYGWVRPYGLKFEVYLKTVFIDNVLAPKVRPYVVENPYHEFINSNENIEDDGLNENSENIETVKNTKKPKKKKVSSEYKGYK